MMIDDVFISNLKLVGEYYSKMEGIKIPPSSTKDLVSFFTKIQSNMKNDTRAVFFCIVLEELVSKEEVRKRNVTARVFEEILAKALNGEVADEKKKANPNVPDEIKNLDSNLKQSDVRVSTDLSNNKREKGDLIFKETNLVLSVKTQIGPLANCEIKVDNGEKVAEVIEGKAN